MEEEEDMLPPFWLPPGQADRRLGRRLRRSYSIFLSSSALLIFLVVTALIFIFIVIPTLLSFMSHIFKPNLVKKSWDSLNLVLVLFAIVCGFLTRNTNESVSSDEDQNFSPNAAAQDYTKSNSTTPRQWYEYSDRNSYSSYTRLRSISSYPDLRQESLWVGGDERWRFYDDTRLVTYREADMDEHRKLRHRRSRTEVDEEGLGIENVVVGSFGFRTDSESAASVPPQVATELESELPSLPSSPPRTPPVRRKARRTYQAIGQAGNVEKQGSNDSKAENLHPPPSIHPPSQVAVETERKPLSPVSSPPSTPPVRRNVKRAYQAIGRAEKVDKQGNDDLKAENLQRPPPSPPPSLSPEFQGKSQNKKKRGSATKEFLISLKGKKKKQRQRSVENFESILYPEPSVPPPSPPPSPPPPPPPMTSPPSVFQSLFSSTKAKHKKRHSASAPVPSPPSPPPLRLRVSKPKPRIAAVSTHKPHILSKKENFNRLQENVVIGNESPLIPIPPPPPPPPPFKMPAWKFRLQGDFVRLDSFSSRSSSPDLDDIGDSPRNEASQCSSPSGTDDGGESKSEMPVFCPSPDVDTKADTFIARFRAGLKLEKMNSMRNQGIRKSNLGPSPNPSPGNK